MPHLHATSRELLSYRCRRGAPEVQPDVERQPRVKAEFAAVQAVVVVRIDRLPLTRPSALCVHVHRGIFCGVVLQQLDVVLAPLLPAPRVLVWERERLGRLFEVLQVLCVRVHTAGLPEVPPALARVRDQPLVEVVVGIPWVRVADPAVPRMRPLPAEEARPAAQVAHDVLDDLAALVEPETGHLQRKQLAHVVRVVQREELEFCVDRPAVPLRRELPLVDGIRRVE